MIIGLKPRCTPGAALTRIADGWRLEIPAGKKGAYRLAQLDDYTTISRRHFPHTPPLILSLCARVSASNLPGTWGFGLWNDPFGFSLGFGGTAGRLPVLPNAAWFFHASPPNWLAVHDEIPAQGFFAGMIQSPSLPSLLVAPGLLVAPLLTIRPFSRLLRRLASRRLQQDAVAITVDDTVWHQYSFIWLRAGLSFKIDGETILQTAIAPSPPLGLVIWIDNQFAAWTPQGRLAAGTLENPAAWLDIGSVEINRVRNEPL